MLYLELNGRRGIGSCASFYGARSWIERVDLVAQLSGHAGYINTLSFLNSKTCYVVGRTNQVKIWSRDGELLSCSGADGLVNIHTVYPDFDLNTRIDTGHTEDIFIIKFMLHSSDRTILTAAGDAQVRIFDVEYTSRSQNSDVNKSNQLPPPIPAPSDEQDYFLGRNIAALRDIVPLKQYPYSEREHRVYKYHPSWVKRIVTEDNPYTFLTCSEDGSVRHWDLRQPGALNVKREGSRSSGVGEYYGMSTIDDKDEDGLNSHGAPPQIGYRKWGIERLAFSCSTSQPSYIALGGQDLSCFLHDRRMCGRDLVAERATWSCSSSSTASATATDTATRCVRMFVPRSGSGGGWFAPQITSCMISDAYPDNILVSWRGDGIYMFRINHSPEELSSGSHEQRMESWDLDKRRDCHPPTLADPLEALKEKLAPLKTAPSSSEDRDEHANDILSAATDTYRRIRRKINFHEQRSFEFLTTSTLVKSEAECGRLDRRRESQRQRREALDWVRAVGFIADEVLLGDVDDYEKDIEELEYHHDVTYRVFKLARGYRLEEGGTKRRCRVSAC
ncbi:WD40-repeat-containing domain protein [Tuber indicum]|nr:WD40-repeat-containing domain protein [Tuber indicum]